MPTHKLTTDNFKEKVYGKFGDKVEILSEYNGGTSPINILYHCDKHGDTYKTLNAKNIFGSSFQPCKKCDLEKKSISGKNKLKTKEEYYERLKTYVEDKGGKLITKEWTTAKSEYEVHCGNSEHPNFFSTADSLVNKPQWCPYCSGRKGNFEEEIQDIIHSKNGQLLSKYINASTHVNVRCKLHNYDWDITPSNLRKGRWCPVCSLPYSEKVVYDYLTNNKYNIEIQYTFDNLKSENNELLKFDFAILDKNDNLLGLLEVDDNEHRHNHKSKRRIKARERDVLKNDYCNENHIELLRLEYQTYSKQFKDYNWYYSYIHNKINTYLTNLIKHNKQLKDGDYYIKSSNSCIQC